jgi:hypothetical protein
MDTSKIVEEVKTEIERLQKIVEGETAELDRLKQVVNLLEGSTTSKRKRPMSQETKDKIAAGRKKAWAKEKKSE